MNNKSKRITASSLAGVMTLAGVAGAMGSVEVQSVKASVSSDVQAVHAKVEHITYSLKNNYLGLKNVGQWQVYIKEAKVLNAKLPNGSSKDKYAERINKAEALVNAAARVNHVEKSMAINAKVMRNVPQWEAYIELAKADLAKVDQSVFKPQYNELLERAALRNAEIEEVKANGAKLDLLAKDGQVVSNLNYDYNVDFSGNKTTLSDSVIKGDLKVTGNKNKLENVTVEGTLIIDLGENNVVNLTGVKAGDIEIISGKVIKEVADLIKLVAEDLGNVVDVQASRVTAGFGLGNKIENIESVEVKLYAGDELLATNTATTKFFKDLAEYSSFSTPFVVKAGTFDIEADGYWSSKWVNAPEVTKVADKVECTVVDIFGNSQTVTNDKFTGATWEELFTASCLKDVKSSSELKAALSDAETKLINVTEDFEVEEKIAINNEVIINGNGNTITVSKDLGKDASSKHALGIEGDNVTINNLTVNSDKKAYGVQVFASSNIALNNVTFTNSKGAGLTVNGAGVTAINLNTSGNAWGAINVDPGSGVKAASILTLSGSGVLAEKNQIWSDGKNVTDEATVTVNAQGYTESTQNGIRFWTK